MNLSLEDAYKVQQLSKARRLARGEHIVGYKLGFTSRAKMEQMGVHDLIWGFLSNTMIVENGKNVDLSKYIHPRVEPEIAFKVKKTIKHSLTLENVKEYIESVAPALEIIDSRFKNFKFSLEDVVADNCSSTGFVVGEWQDVDVPINDLKMELICNNQVVETGNSNAILGNPWESVVELSRLIAARQQVLEPGYVIMAGAATAAKFLEPNMSVSTKVEKLGEVGFSVNNLKV